MAVATGAAQDDVVCRDLVAAAVRDSLEGLLERRILERLYLAAVVADKMVMMVAARVDPLEAGDPVAQVDALDKAELVEALERAVHARDSDSRSLRAHAVVDLLSGKAAVLTA